MAPELCAEIAYDEKVDAWSSGVILYILITGQPPFIGKSKEQIYEVIQKKEPDYKNKQLTRCSPNLMDFLQRCFQKKAAKRASI